MGKVGHKNEDYSKSVSSSHSGPILPPSSAKELSRNVFVVFVYAFEKKLLTSIGSGMMPKMAEISGKVVSATSRSNFGGPAGGSALERASPPMGGEK